MPTKEETILSQSNEPFIKVKKSMITELGLSGCQLLIYAIISSFTESSGAFTGGVIYFEKEYGFRHQTVCYALRSLVKTGLVYKKYEGGKFTYTTVQKPHHSTKTAPVSKNRTEGVQKAHHDSMKNAPLVYEKRTTNKKDKKEIESVRNARARVRPSAEDAAAAILRAMEEGV